MITATTMLKELILVKEVEHEAERRSLKAHFDRTHESLKLTNILKSTLENVIAAPGIKRSVINAGIGFVTGLIIKKVFPGKTNNPIAKLLATMI